MDIRQKTRCKSIYGKRLVILFILFSGYNLIADENFQKIEVGKEISIFIPLNFPRLSSKEFKIIKTESAKDLLPFSKEMEFKTDKYEYVYGIVFYFTAKESGFARSPEIEYTIRGKKYKIESTPVKVVDQNGFCKPRLFWQIRKTDFFEGENVALDLVLKDFQDFIIPSKIDISDKIEGFYLDESDVYSKIDEYNYYNINLKSTILMSYIVTPFVSGSFLIPSATAIVNGYKITSEPMELFAKKMPNAVKQSSFGYGDFELSASSSSSGDIKLGETLVLSIKVHGNGNLNFIKRPKVLSNDFLLTQESVKENKSLAGDIFIGYKEFIYEFFPKTRGTAKIKIEPFVYYSLNEQKIRTIETKDLSFNVISADDKKLERKFTFLSYLDIENQYYVSLFQKYMIVLLAPAIFILIYTFFLKNIIARSLFYIMTVFLTILFTYTTIKSVNFNLLSKFKENEKYLSKNNLKTAYISYLESLKVEQDVSGVYYNIALCAYNMGNSFSANYFLREALKRDLKKTYLDLYYFINKTNSIDEFEFKNNNFPSRGFNEFLFFIFLDFTVLFFVAFRRNNKMKYHLLKLLFLLLMLSFALGFLFFSRDLRCNALVKDDVVYFKKIPSFQAHGYSILKKGDLVNILDERDEHYFARTIYNTTGWIDRKQLYPSIDYFSKSKVQLISFLNSLEKEITP